MSLEIVTHTLLEKQAYTNRNQEKKGMQNNILTLAEDIQKSSFVLIIHFLNVVLLLQFIGGIHAENYCK